MSHTPEDNMQVAVIVKNETIDILLRQLERTMAERALVDAALGTATAAQKRCREEIAELEAALRTILKYRAGLNGHYFDAVERITQQRRDDVQHMADIATAGHLTFFVLVLLMLISLQSLLSLKFKFEE
ncbi:hypothetical protein HYPSUDRAFT_59843 [Hypholoma sublateritium FD-334 SS-4]|uniref:Uncharacterized protein n=1 Tax=Hypholoma sublateritium (strain FD-334 SS-4) TaxID=945553 RepID=A0A0D2NYN2_HYPSF|nr:hypothetical protein HYPSUDRAFT_59843 [Hypholoma sublateritium FD-334 SS-4]